MKLGEIQIFRPQHSVPVGLSVNSVEANYSPYHAQASVWATEITRETTSGTSPLTSSLDVTGAAPRDSECTQLPKEKI